MEKKKVLAGLVLKGKKELAEDEAINPSPADTLTSSPPFGNPFIRKSKLGDFFKSYTTSEAINLGPADILMQIFKIHKYSCNKTQTHFPLNKMVKYIFSSLFSADKL